MTPTVWSVSHNSSFNFSQRWWVRLLHPFIQEPRPRKGMQPAQGLIASLWHNQDRKPTCLASEPHPSTLSGCLPLILMDVRETTTILLILVTEQSIFTWSIWDGKKPGQLRIPCHSVPQSLQLLRETEWGSQWGGKSHLIIVICVPQWSSATANGKPRPPHQSSSIL